MKRRSSVISAQRSARPSSRDRVEAHQAVRGGKGVKVEHSLTINRSAEELFSFWRDLENLTQVMEHIHSIECLDEERSHWRARISEDKIVEWDSEIINEIPNELIAWQSLPGSDIRQAGTVRFAPAPGGVGTEVKLTLEYEMPGGSFANSLAKLWRRSPEQQIREDLRHFKQLMEAGEIPTTEGQPAGRDEDKSKKYEEAK